MAGLDWRPDDPELNRFVVGDCGNDIYEADFSKTLAIDAPADEGHSADAGGGGEGGEPEPEPAEGSAEAAPYLELRQLMEGASSCVFGTAVHPTRHNIYATACEDGAVYIWDASRHTCVRKIDINRLGHLPGKRPVDWPMGRPWPFGQGELLRVRAVAFSPDGTKLACSTGCESGRSGVYSSATGRRMWSHYDKGGVVRVYSLQREAADAGGEGGEGGGAQGTDVLVDPSAGGVPEGEMNQMVICDGKVSSEGIDTLSFSPDSRYLGCGSHDNFVYIVDTAEKLAKPAGKGSSPTRVPARTGEWDSRRNRVKVVRSAAVHSSYITHIDWSTANGGVDERGRPSSLLQTSSGVSSLC